MEKEQVKQVRLSDGKLYSGWGYYTPKGCVPSGCGEKTL